MKHSIFSHSLYGTEAEPDVTGTVDGELEEALVDIGSENLNPHPFGLLHHDGDLLDVTDVPAQHSSHELGRVVCLEIPCLVGYQRIAGGVRLVECIFGERFPVRPYLVYRVLVVAVSAASLDKLLLEPVHDVTLLFPHRLAQ